MTIRNPFRKKPEKKAAAPAPAPRRTSPTSGARPASYNYDPNPHIPAYSPPPGRSDDCGTSSSHDSGSSHGGHSSSHDSGSSHSSSSCDSGSSSSCGGGGGD